MHATQDPEILAQWIGREETLADTLHIGPANLMEMTLDRASSLKHGDPLPPLWHWLYFLQSAPLRALGRDGHPAKGGFLPPVSLPRRMWAGGRFGFNKPMRLGSSATKKSTITNVAPKVGRSGALCFVTVRHEVAEKDCPTAFWEEHDIVYREDPGPTPLPQQPNPIGTQWHHTETIIPSEVMLFRYSALTFNGHRIHYDRDYARDVEGHAGLVVHGPLIATMLMDFAQRVTGSSSPTSFKFRAASPLFDTAAFTLHARVLNECVELAAATPQGNLAMQATAEF